MTLLPPRRRLDYKRRLYWPPAYRSTANSPLGLPPRSFLRFSFPRPPVFRAPCLLLGPLCAPAPVFRSPPPPPPGQALAAQLDQEARHAVAQAAALSDRLVGAEQEFGFEAARNERRLREKDEGNVRARAAAAAAADGVAIAERALRCKGREVEQLRARCAREGVALRGKRGGGGGCAKGLEFRVFAAAADARASAERCAAAAAERRVTAGTALAEALRGVGSGPGAEADGTGIGCLGDGSDDDDDDDNDEAGEFFVLVFRTLYNVPRAEEFRQAQKVWVVRAGFKGGYLVFHPPAHL